MPGISSRHLIASTSLAAAVAIGASLSGHGQEARIGVLDEHPSIQYVTRPTTDRVAQLNDALKHGRGSLVREGRTGYLLPLLDALNIPRESQLLVFSKTGVQSAFTSPQNPRALYFNESTVVGYVPGAPVIEVASDDPQQGVVFYALEQASTVPSFARRTSCLTCHVSASTMNVPGLITRSNMVGDDGNLVPQSDTHDVTHATAHPDRWGGWFVTQAGAPAPYSQRGHLGNITFSGQGNTSNQVFVDWMLGSPETRGYPLSSSDTVALLTFDHQAHAINLLTRLNWESRVSSAEGHDALSDRSVRPLVDELAAYFLFTDEAPLPVPLTPLPGFAEQLRSRTPADRKRRSFGELELSNRLLRYPCSYMVYSAAFDGLPAPVRQAVYRRMTEILMASNTSPSYGRVSADDRRAILEILKETKPDFPRQ